MDSPGYYPPPGTSWHSQIYPDTQADYPTPPSSFHEQTSQQLESLAGPSRVLTRRQRALQHAPVPRRPYDPSIQRQSSLYNVSISRPQTPSNHESYHQSDGLSITLPVVQPSPNYLPLTPASASSSSASPYTSYGFYSTTHSRANSISNSTNPRSASPALSTASALTSVSSTGALSAPRSTGSDTTSAKQKKQRLFNVDRKEICLYAKENPNARQEDIARIYGVERSTISKILKHKVKWLNVAPEENLRIAKHRPSKFPNIEKDMMEWLVECRDKQTILSDSMIRTKAKEIAQQLGIGEDRFKASSGWIENFKHRHGVRSGIWTGDGKNVRTARALGLGAPPDDSGPLLSPLNPSAFGTQGDDEMMDAVGEGAGELHPEGDEAHHSQDTPSDASIRPSWLIPHPVDPSPQPPPPPDDQQPVYYEALPRTAPQPTTLAEAEDAINKVIHFIDTSEPGILQPHERNALTTIKCALFQYASGIPYDRTALPYEQMPAEQVR